MPLPAVLALLLSYAVAGQRPASYANTIAAGALVLALTYVTFEIRRLYHGPVLTRGPTTGVEQYTYSIAWLAFGVALLGIGIFFNSQRARLASAAVIALTILKAFLIDVWTMIRRLPRAVVHVPGRGADGDRLAVPADPVPQAGAAATCPLAETGAARFSSLLARFGNSVGRTAQFRSAFRFRRFRSGLGFDRLDLGFSTRGVSTRADTSTEPVCCRRMQRTRPGHRPRHQHLGGALMAEIAIGEAHARHRAAEAALVFLVEIETGFERNALDRRADGLAADLQRIAGQAACGAPGRRR